MLIMSTQPRDASSSREDPPEEGSRLPWAGDPPQASAARGRLLEAAARCIARDGIAATSVAAIAAEAGVSRQTVYRYFSGRDALVLGCLRATAEEVRAAIDQQLRALVDPADMIVETLVLGLDAVRGDPVLRAISDASSPGALGTQITGPAGIAWVREPLAPAIEAAGWDEDHTDACLELILRLFLSWIISPQPQRSPEELRAFLYRHVIPGLGLAACEEA